MKKVFFFGDWKWKEVNFEGFQMGPYLPPKVFFRPFSCAAQSFL